MANSRNVIFRAVLLLQFNLQFCQKILLYYSLQTCYKPNQPSNGKRVAMTDNKVQFPVMTEE